MNLIDNNLILILNVRISRFFSSSASYIPSRKSATTSSGRTIKEPQHKISFYRKQLTARKQSKNFLNSQQANFLMLNVES